MSHFNSQRCQFCGDWVLIGDKIVDDPRPEYKYCISHRECAKHFVEIQRMNYVYYYFEDSESESKNSKSEDLNN
jgi:hypothetical protein